MNDNKEEEVQLAAVKKYGWAIERIDNPSEKVQLAAIKQNGFAIQFIKNPSEKVQLAAVKKYGWTIQYIKNPTEKVQLAALENEWTKYSYEEYIKNLPNKTEWFYREFNRLKLIKGSLL